MEYRAIPHFIVKNPMNKTRLTGKLFSDEVSIDILADVCYRITGQTHFTYDYVDNDYTDEFIHKSYNKGRIAILQYADSVSYISFSEQKIGGRNSSVQSVPTAFNLFYSNPYPNKRLYYYFLNNSEYVETDYQILIYRLMRTIGYIFLNAGNSLCQRIQPFNSVDDIIYNRKINTVKNKSNNSTFITKGSNGEIQIYGKTYGANKYETSLICYALSQLWQTGQTIQLYEVLEGNLDELPKSSLNVIQQMGVIEVYATDRTLEKRYFEKNNSLRSPRYLYNLYNKLGNKHCALCNCEIPELIQGAHIWLVSSIKNDPLLTPEQQLECALDGENGLWLCENHHKMFDESMFNFDQNGKIIFHKDIAPRHMKFIEEITPCTHLNDKIITDKFLWYLSQRHHRIN